MQLKVLLKYLSFHRLLGNDVSHDQTISSNFEN